VALSHARRRAPRPDYWPGFVDVMATLLLVFIFLLSIFMLSQFFLSREISGRDTVLNRLNAEIARLTDMLSLDRARSSGLSDTIASLQASLAEVTAERDRLGGLVSDQTATSTDGRISALTGELTDQQKISDRALAQVELLNQQISALRRQIAALETALQTTETENRESQVQIDELGRRLNIALAQRVQELSRYRSDFFGRLREILGNRDNIRQVGDRWIIQSEVLFATGSADINAAGTGELDKIAQAALEISRNIPTDIDWTLQINGHTDKRPLAGSGRFRSNWELSAGRAISVVEYLISRGVPADRLVAAGYGEYQPLEKGDTDEAYARNRRIELKITER
jgi:chemotaxis protein MotB